MIFGVSPKPNSNVKTDSNVKTTSSRANKAKSMKPNLPNQVCLTSKSTKPNLPKQQKQSKKLNS